uniref:MBOAT family O-acyltransferase n=1 Tax=Vallitalea guaymasensis TaxID=1185412 RepID=UPI003FCCD60B
MIFSTPIFIFLFLPCILAVYYISPSKLKNTSLFLASLVFYAWGEPVYVSIMLFSTVFDYINGLSIEKFKSQKKHNKAKLVLIISIVGNLAILFFFKYSNFLISNINQLASLDLTPLDLKLPIGISFYTFQTMSYTIDVYRGEVKAQRNIIDFGTFVSLFPQLVAGPIVRYKTIAEQLKHRVSSINKFSEGVQRFIIGMGKKVLLANNIGM